MTVLRVLWLPILLSAVFVHIASAIIHMALSFWHKSDYAKLPQEEKVLEARYYMGHPYLDRPTLSLRTRGEKPQQVLKRVLKDLSDLYGDLLADFEKKADKVKA